MRNECMGIINLEDKRNASINQLTYSRPIASTPIAGRYRVIDFVLSNMVNSGITNVGVFSREKYRSLTDHLGSGKDWDLSRKKGGLFIFSPENTKNRSRQPYKSGDIYGILANIDYIEKSDEEYVLIAPSYMICNIDYKDALNYHKNSENDVTVLYKDVNNADVDFNSAATLVLNEDKVVNMGSNLGTLTNSNISMETYIMSRTKFIESIYDCVSKGNYSYIEDFIAGSLNELKVGSYKHEGYLKCVNSVKSYFAMNKELLEESVSEELLYSGKKILTKEQNQAPTIYTDDAKIENSFIATGCTIEGTVKNSIIFRKVHVKKGAVIENSVIMQGCTVDEEVTLDNVIFDKYVQVSKKKEIKGDECYPVVIEKDICI